MLAAQLVEHRLPADEAGIGRGVALALASDSRAWLLLAEADGAAVGVTLANRIVSVEHGGEALWVEELYVVPSSRRTGVATALLDELERRGVALGIRALELEVVPTQAAAFALYDSRGFRRVDRARLSKALR